MLGSIAAENIRACRAILAGESMTPEQAELDHWWRNLTHVQRSAMFLLAGVQYPKKTVNWLAIPDQQRAALVLTARAFSENLNTIQSTLKFCRQNAMARLQSEAEKLQAVA